MVVKPILSLASRYADDVAKVIATSSDDVAKYTDNLSKNISHYVKQHNKINGTNYNSILQIKPNKIDLGSAFSHTHIKPRWEMFSEAPSQAYATKPAVYIEKIIADGKGAGTREIKRIVRESLANPETEGRVLLSAEMLNPKKGHPAGFYYKLGFRSCDDGVNKACAEWLSNGGDINLAPGRMHNGKIIPLGTKSGFRTIMYLPKENIQHCLNYPDIKGLKICPSVNILENNGMMAEVDTTIEMLEQAGKQLGKISEKTTGHSVPTHAVNLLDDIEVAGIRLVRSPSTDVFTSHSVLNAKNEVVGSVRLSVAPDEIQSLCTPAGAYPASWFDETGALKPFIEIEQMNTLGHQGEGYGRRMIQAIHKLSKRLGFGGRVSAESAEYAKTFYSKCGFDIPPNIKKHYDELYESCLKIAKEQNLSQAELQALMKSKGVPEIINGKYNIANQRIFNPTEENIQLLFPNGLNA